MLNKRGIELAFSKIVWWIILAIFLVIVLLWYTGIGSNITQMLDGIL